MSVDGRTLRHQHRRPELLAAAVEYLLDHGIADLTLRPLADELGVTHATLLRHFGSKEALVTEAIAAIRTDLFDRLRGSAASIDEASLGRVMWDVWKRLCEPTERRQFVLLFEVVALRARRPDRYGELGSSLIDDFLGRMTVAFDRAGRSPREARDLATGFLAELRGLQLDLAVSGDQRRVDAAMRRYIEAMTGSTV